MTTNNVQGVSTGLFKSNLFHKIHYLKFTFALLLALWDTAEAYLNPCQMERFVKILQGIQTLTTFTKQSILDVWQGSENVSALWLSQRAQTKSWLVSFIRLFHTPVRSHESVGSSSSIKPKL